MLPLSPDVAPLLQLETYGLCFGSRIVLSRVDLVLPAPGVDILMGPVKAGKSTLVRSLAGLHANNRLARGWGRAWYNGVPLDASERPALVQQHASALGGSLRDALVAPSRGLRERSARAWTEFAEEALGLYGLATLCSRLATPLVDLPTPQQRAVNILGHALAGPRLLMIDEPTFGLEESEANGLVDWLGVLGRRCRLLVVLHHQGQARRLGDRIILLGGGRVLAHAPGSVFFGAPPNRWVEQFVRSGSLAIASPGARPEDLCPDVEPPPPLPDEALAVLAAFDAQAAGAASPACQPSASAAAVPPAPAESASTIAPAPPAPAAPPGPPAPPAAPASQYARPEPSGLSGLSGSVAPAAGAGLPAAQASAAAASPSGASPNVARASTLPSAAGLASAQRRAPLPPVSRAGVGDAALVGRSLMVDHRGPHGFHWVVPGKLAGCPEPGIVHDIDYDLDLLARIGVQVLVTLTERDIDTAALARHGLRNIHLPIFDREAPTLAQAYMLIRRIQKLMDEGKTVAVHCKAGIGRTGTVLAAWMIREGGLSASSALQLLRNVNRAYVQTPLQEAFLHELEADIVARL